MRGLQLLVLVIVSIVVLPSCADPTDTDYNKNAMQNYNCPNAVKRSINGINKLTFQYIHERLVSNCSTIIFSPLASYYQLGLIGIYTKNSSRAYIEMLKVMGLRSKEEIRCALLTINTFYFNKPAEVNYRFSDNLISDCDNIFTEPFKRDGNALLLSEPRNYNFGNPKEVQRKVNKIIEDDTGLKNAVPCSNIYRKNSTASKLVIAGARYFEPSWNKAFIPVGKKTYTDMESNTYKIDFVTQCDTYNYTYSAELDAEIIQFSLRYDFFLYTMFVPMKPYNLIELTEKLQDANIYNQAMKSLKKKELKLTLPKYDSAATVTNVVNVLKKLGLVTPYFDAATSSIVDGYGKKRNVYLADGIVKKVFTNNLEGETPNSAECLKNKRGNLKEVLVNRPMIYQLTRLGVTSFCGVGKIPDMDAQS